MRMSRDISITAEVLSRLSLEPAELEPLYGAAGRLMVMPATLDKLE